MATQKLYIKWEEFERHTVAMANLVKNSDPWKNGEIKGLLAITRGGLCPTGILARELDIRLIETMCIVSYESESADGQTEANVLKDSDLIGDGSGWLIVDDLVDTGKTFDILRERFPKATFVTVYAKPEGRARSDMFMIEVPQETWLVLPWEEQN